ncbi:MAG: hypothetical protein ACYC4K_01995 [Thiobacillus sp.]
MMRAILAGLCLVSLSAQAAWEFSAPIEVGTASGKVFHHLESANRKALAESGGRVALVWEDNRAGAPRCWLAVRESNAEAFAAPQAITGGECYEPVVQGMGGRFVLGWEEKGAVWIKASNKGRALKLSRAPAAQLTLAKVDEHTVHAAWAEQAGKHKRIMTARITLEANGPKIQTSAPLEKQLPKDEQAYPALIVNSDGSVAVVWEDRRFKHTMMMAAHSADGKTFGSPVQLIDVPRARAITLGAGMGSMRPTLASCGNTCVVAAWLDKRDFLAGYDVYAAFSQDGGRSFGRNIKVQDSFGDNVSQWHAAITANPAGRMVAIWDDDRDGTPDVWLSDWNGTQFSDNVGVLGATGPGAQTDPVLYLDSLDKLHIAWLEKIDGGGTRLRYASAIWKK